MSDTERPVTVTVQHGDTETMIRLSLAEFGNFVARPIIETLDDSEASWDMQEAEDPEERERFHTLFGWATGLYRVTAD